MELLKTLLYHVMQNYGIHSHPTQIVGSLSYELYSYKTFPYAAIKEKKILKIAQMYNENGIENSVGVVKISNKLI